MAEFANSIDPDDVAHLELPHLNLWYLPSGLCIFNLLYFG